jgi:hypothetical protein
MSSSFFEQLLFVHVADQSPIMARRLSHPMRVCLICVGSSSLPALCKFTVKDETVQVFNSFEKVGL